MKVKIGSLEISDVSLEELHELVSRYGGSIPAGDVEQPAAGKRNGAATHHGGASDAPPADTVVLKKLVEAGSVGVETKVLGEILQRKGKATKGAMKKWAKRVALTEDEANEPFEACRIGTKRGMKLKPGSLDVAKMLLEKR